jgi:hypothetical protein
VELREQRIPHHQHGLSVSCTKHCAAIRWSA